MKNKPNHEDTKMLSAVSDLIDDLHDNHDYFANWLGCNCAPDHGARHVRRLLQMLGRRPEYTEWADAYLQQYGSAEGGSSGVADLKGGAP
jgi:hypothetical protein